jgi:predicted secreted protein
MNDPRRLLDERDDPRARLLASALADAPSNAARARAREAMGLPPKPGVPGPGEGGGGGASGVNVRWVALASVALLIGVGAIVATRPAAPIASTVPSAPPSSASATSATTAIAQPPGTTDAAELASASVAVPSASVAVPNASALVASTAVGFSAPPVASASASVPITCSLSDEVASLDKVRVALATSGAAALADLARHERECPGGSMTSEATMLRLEALVHAGKEGDARALARRLVSADPNGPYVRRVLSLVPDARP